MATSSSGYKDGYKCQIFLKSDGYLKLSNYFLQGWRPICSWGLTTPGSGVGFRPPNPGWPKSGLRKKIKPLSWGLRFFPLFVSPRRQADSRRGHLAFVEIPRQPTVLLFKDFYDQLHASETEIKNHFPAQNAMSSHTIRPIMMISIGKYPFNYRSQ